MSQFILAHDLGTSGNKATLFAADGRIICSTIASYKTHYFNINWAEQNPEDWWQAICLSTRALLEKSSINPASIAAISFSGHMMGCLCLDKSGNPLRPHILWADQRSQAQAAALADRISPSRFYRITGHRNSPSYGLQKLMWVRDHEPEIYEATAKVVNAKDWLVFRLTGKLYSEYSDATSMTALDLNHLKWSEEIIEAARIDGDKLPTLVASTHVAGGVTAQAAAATGLAAGTPVVMGGGDGLCGTVGAGCVKEGVVHACIGSSAWISFATDKPLYDDQMRTFNWAHIIPGMICPCGTMQTAGSAYSWLLQEIATSETEQARQTGGDAYSLVQEKISSSPPGANGVIFLPYLLGERSPRWNSDAKGTFLGIKMETRRSDLFRSVLEGVTMNLGIIVDIYRQNGYPLKDVNIIGGGAKDKIWCQMMANIWQSNIHCLKNIDEATGMGAAVTGGVGVGLYQDFSAVEQFISIAQDYHPESAAIAAYQPVKKVFDQCYQALVPVFPLLSELGSTD
jgi:xylulokinase